MTIANTPLGMPEAAEVYDDGEEHEETYVFSIAGTAEVCFPGRGV
ncbi:hypothetical protein [Streptomyces cyaneofuscatus]